MYVGAAVQFSGVIRSFKVIKSQNFIIAKVVNFDFFTSKGNKPSPPNARSGSPVVQDIQANTRKTGFKIIIFGVV